MTALSGATLRSASAFPGSPPLDLDGPAASADLAGVTAGTALSLDGVSLSFGGVAALSDVTFAVTSGAIHAVIGPNGAGKSSLLNVVSGLYRPDRGRVRLLGKAFRHVPASHLARLGVARTFQNLALFPGLDVLGNVVMGRVAARRSGFLAQAVGTPRACRERDDALARAGAVLDFLDLRGVARRPVASLPYGLQKRVELARAIVAESRLLLLDEPMAGMTAAEKRESAGAIRAARARYGLTVVMIEHDIGVVMDLSDAVTVLDGGRVIADGPPAAVGAEQAVIDAYLGIAHEEDAR